tara:strand:+ start:302 stop:547 length:246 start_codon:yes stop_codon:yes gene_type:complete
MKKTLLTIGVLMTMSFAPETNNTNWELYEAITAVEDYIEWANEDLFNGRLSDEEHSARVESYKETIKHLQNIERTLVHLSK